ncbi:hypothetical protein QCA50_003975 [Cerrena zonata]|uniref:Transmembrane protein n=1 Tax=Cerrena zonata TaxID=2478898 RepID=A0AAW0GSZ0_9APHY
MADPDSASNTANNFIINLDDTSPVIVYSASDDASQASNFSAGWIVSGPSSGTSLHSTAADGASMSLRWNGTGVSLYGELDPSDSGQQPNSVTYSVILDGTPTTNYDSFFSASSDYANNILASFSNLTYDQHTIELVMHNPQQISDGSVLLKFDRAVLTSGVPAVFWDEQDSGSGENLLETSVFPDASISYRGQWSFSKDLLPDPNDAFHTTNNAGDRAVLSFNGTAITISGLTTSLSGSYNISLDGEIPVTLSAQSSINSSTPTVLYFRTGLDPSVMHKLGIVNIGDDASANFLAVGSVNVTTVVQGNNDTLPPMPSSKLSSGLIAGIAVAASVGFLALIAFIVFCARRRRRATRRKQSLVVNPRLSSLRRFSFLAHSIRSPSNRSVHSPPGEKEPHFSPKAPEGSQGGVLDIRAQKDVEDEIDDVEAARGIHEVRHASQNSDGSFSIDLPQLPTRGYTHVRTSSGQQSIPISSVPAPVSTSRFSVRPSKPMGPRSMNPSSPTMMHQRETSRGILLAEMYRAAMGDDHANANAEPSTSAAQTSGTMKRESRQTDEFSPLRVNFDDEPYETTLQRREGRYASAGVISLPQSLKLALSLEPSSIQSSPPIPPNVTVTRSTPVTPITPITPITPVTQQYEFRHDHHLSFLDLDSSGSASLKSGARSTGQSRSNSTRSSSKSRYDPSTTTDYGSLLPDRRISLGLSMAMAGPSSSRPSLSPNISLQPISLPAQSSPHEPASMIPEDASQPIDPDSNGHAMDFLPSPTESIPHTVSDIHFRHSSYSTVSLPTESRRASVNRYSGVQRHPPLPGTPTAPPQEPKPFIVQKLLGMAPSGPGPTTPYSSPTTPGQSSAWPPSASLRGNVPRSHPYSLAPPSFQMRPK